MSRKTNYLFLVGAPKSGTSSLARMLGRDPSVARAKVKETLYFTDFAEREWSGPGADGIAYMLQPTWAAFEAQFSDNPDAIWRVDASTDYLSCPVTPARLAAFAKSPEVGQVKVVVMLRDPVQRCISEYQHTVRDGLETRSLKHAIEQETARMEAGFQPLFWHVYRSNYATQIARYRAHFDDLIVLDFHRIKEGTELVDRVSDAMGLPRAPVEEMHGENQSYVYRFGFVHRVIQNAVIKDIARAIVPARFRDGVRQSINSINQTSYSPSAVELQMLRDALRDEIDACVADPAIPTDRWTLALEHS